MKQTILAVLIVTLVATPCLAQEVEPEGLFSIEETRWNYCGIAFSTLLPFIGGACFSVGFYQDTVYMCTLNGDCFLPPSSTDSYIDSPLVSIWYDIEFTNFVDWYIRVAVMQPTGFGILSDVAFVPECRIRCPSPHPAYFLFAFAFMFKIENNWKPPEDEPPTE